MNLTHNGRLPVSFGYAAAASALCLAVISGLYFGEIRITFSELFDMLAQGPVAAVEEEIKYGLVWRLRMPRVLSALMSGAILASSGVIFQAVLRNPLAEPYTLGVASGAAFGASVAIFAGLRWITMASFAGSMAALCAVWALGERDGTGDDVSGVILAGVIVGSILGAGLTLLKAIAGDKLAAIVVWLMGSFADAGMADIRPLSFAVCIILTLTLSHSRELDILASGVDGATLGLDVPKTRMVLLGFASLAVSFVVSRFGVIGFVGLVAPHLIRILFGPPHRHLLPLSFMLGAALLCAADTIAKVQGELPAGVLTVLVGGPVFCLILWKRK